MTEYFGEASGRLQHGDVKLNTIITARITDPYVRVLLLIISFPFK